MLMVFLVCPFLCLDQWLVLRLCRGFVLPIESYPVDTETSSYGDSSCSSSPSVVLCQLFCFVLTQGNHRSVLRRRRVVSMVP